MGADQEGILALSMFEYFFLQQAYIQIFFGWSPKNWCFWTVVLEKTLESPLDCKEIKPVNPKGNQFWIFIGRTDGWSSNTLATWWKSQLIRKDPDAGKDWRQEEKRRTEDEMVGWHHLLDEHDFEQTLGDSKGQESLVCYHSWCPKECQTRLSTWTTNLKSSLKF